jgi:hypothetical protein
MAHFIHPTKKLRIGRIAGGFFACLCLIAVVLNITIPRSSSAAEQASIIPATADAYVKSHDPDHSFGSAGYLDLDADPVIQSYLRFQVSGIGQNTVTPARLRLYVLDGSSRAGLKVFSASSDWDEATLTWKTQPALGGEIANLAPIPMSVGTWIEIDLGQAIRGDGSYNLVLITDSSDRVKFSDRTQAQGPQLVLTSQTGAVATTPTTAATAATTATPLAATATPAPSSSTATPLAATATPAPSSSTATPPAATAAPAPSSGSAQAITTFSSIGLYWSPTGGSQSAICEVRYRRVGETEWHAGYPLWFDTRNAQYRGSLVQLLPNTSYEIVLNLKGSTTQATLTATTWSEQFPIAQTKYLPAGTTNQPLVVSQSGTPNGYIVYTAPSGQASTIDVANNSDTNITVNASYVIIRGLTLKNARRHSIRLDQNAHDVVIEGNDISGWGRIAADGWGENYDAAIYSNVQTVKRITIQRNRMHHPRADTNSWLEERTAIAKTSSGWHPNGPQAVSMFNTDGNHVIRYNDVYSDKDHYFNDCMGGGSNSSTRGFPNRDSDIYGNHLEQCWDDAIESEGGNDNVRIWGNYTNNTFQHIAIRDTTVGPIYIWRNVAGISRKGPAGTSDQDPRGSFLKAGGEGGVFIFHNTILQPTQPAPLLYPLGSSRGYSGSALSHAVSRNNILHVYKPDSRSIDTSSSQTTNDFNHDLYNGLLDVAPGQESAGMKAVPSYDMNAAGAFTLAPSSKGYDTAVRIPNFNDGFAGAAPDVGAYEAGTPPLQFGVNAYR